MKDKRRVALVNGKVFTGERETGALLIEGNRILETGPSSQIREMVGDPSVSSTTVVDLGGRTVLPGFVDSHNHVLSVATLLQGVNCFGLGSIDELKEAVSRRAREAAPGQWISGAGWIETQFREKRAPSRKDLDEAAPHNPVVLSRLFGATAANSMALKAAGIGRGYVPRAGRVDRDSDGEPTGVLRDAAQGLLRRAQHTGEGARGTEETMRLIVLALKELQRYGTTAILDPGVDSDEMLAYLSLWAQEALPIRVSAMPAWHGISSGIAEGEESQAVLAGLQPGFGDEWFKFGNLKMAIDGGLGSKTAMMHAPYIDGSRSTVPARLDLNRLGTYIKDAHGKGWGVGIHCCGDLAQDIAVSHMAEAMGESCQTDRQRHHIIHGYYPTEYALEQMADHDIGVSLQPGFIYVEGDVYPQALPESLLSAYKPAKTYLSRGIKVAINTDVASGPYDPAVTMYGAVARKTVGGLDFGREEALTVREALRCFNEGGAWLSYRDNECGALRPGLLADIAVVDGDILDGDPSCLLSSKVVATMVDGIFVYVADGGPEVPRELRVP